MSTQPLMSISLLLFMTVCPTMNQAASKALQSSVVLINSHNEINTAKINFYQQGVLTRSDTHNLTGHGSVVLAMPEAGFNGSASVEAEHPIIAHALSTRADNKAIEIYNGSITASELYFPLFWQRASTEQSSLISLQNPRSDKNIKFTAQFFDNLGNKMRILTKTLTPLARYDLDSNKLFKQQAVALSVHITADNALSGVEQLRYARDTAAIEAVLPALADNQRYWVSPIVKQQDAKTELAWTELTIHNTNEQPTTITTLFYTDQGVLTARKRKMIPGLGFVKLNTHSLKPSNFNGYAVITGSHLAIQAANIQNTGLAIAGNAAVNETQAGAQWACTHISTNTQSTRTNQIHLLNLNKQTETIQFEQFAPETGISLAKQDVTLKPKQLKALALTATNDTNTSSIYSSLAMISGSANAKLIATVSQETAKQGDASFNCQRLDTKQ